MPIFRSFHSVLLAAVSQPILPRGPRTRGPIQAGFRGQPLGALGSVEGICRSRWRLLSTEGFHAVWALKESHGEKNIRQESTSWVKALQMGQLTTRPNWPRDPVCPREVQCETVKSPPGVLCFLSLSVHRKKNPGPSVWSSFLKWPHSQLQNPLCDSPKGQAWKARDYFTLWSLRIH